MTGPSVSWQSFVIYSERQWHFYAIAMPICGHMPSSESTAMVLQRQPYIGMSNDRKTSLEMNEVQKRADVAEKAEHIREFETSGHNHLLVTHLAELRASSLLCDVVLIAEGMRINAHRNVLAASSDYFKAMFTNDLVESRSREIEMADIEASALVALTDFCYSGKIVISDASVQSILSASCLLQIKEVQAYCCEFLKEELHTMNFLRIRALADRYACQELLRFVDSYILRNFQDIVSSEELCMLPFKLLLELVANEELQVQSEEQVFAAVLQWIRFNPPDRKQFLSKLLKHVRLSLCGTEFLVNTVSKDALVTADRACRKLVDEAKDYQLLQLSGPVRPNMRVTRSRNRKAVEWKECIYIVGGSLGSCAVASVECFDGENPVWRSVASMSQRRFQFGVGVIDNLLYAVGGRDSTSLSSGERYDPVAGRWTSDVASMSTCRSGLGVAALDGFLYSVGGCTWYHHDSVERYDSRRNEWIHVAPMAYSRSGLSVSVLNGCLYAVGGEDGRSLNIVERLDPRVGKWETIRPMSIARKYLGTAVLNGVLYAVGGDDSVSSTSEKYDPLTNKWTSVATMDNERYDFGLAVFNERLYAFGCYGANGYRNVEAFDLKTNRWKIHTRTSDDRRGAGVGVVRMPSQC